MKKFWNVLGCIAATLFSIVLVLIVQVFALRNAASAFTKPSTITQVIQDIDIQELIPDAEEIKNLLPLPESEKGDANEELDAALDSVTAILKSQAVEDLLDLYVQDVLAAVTQNNPEKLLDAEAVKTIARDNLDELIAIIKPYIPEEERPTDEELEVQVLAFVDEFSKEIIEFLPTLTENGDALTLDELLSGFSAAGDLSEFGDSSVISIEAPRFETQRTATTPSDEPADSTDSTSSNPKSWGELDVLSAAIRFLLDPMVTVAFIVVLVVLAAIIYGCRFPRFGGFLWLGIDGLIAAAITALLAVLLNGSFLYSLIPEEAAVIITAVTGVLSRDLTVTAIVAAVIGVVFIVGFALLRRFACNRQPASVEAPISETSATAIMEEAATETIVEDGQE